MLILTVVGGGWRAPLLKQHTLLHASAPCVCTMHEAVVTEYVVRESGGMTALARRRPRLAKSSVPYLQALRTANMPQQPMITLPDCWFGVAPQMLQCCPLMCTAAALQCTNQKAPHDTGESSPPRQGLP